MKRKRGRMDFTLYCKIIDEIAARDKDIRFGWYSLGKLCY